MKNLILFSALCTSIHLLSSDEKPPVRSLPIEESTPSTMPKSPKDTSQKNTHTTQDIEQANALINQGLQAFINSQLIQAIEKFDLAGVENALTTLQADPNVIVTPKNSKAYTPLQCALQLNPLNEHQETIRRTIIIKLLEAGADPFVKHYRFDDQSNPTAKRNDFTRKKGFMMMTGKDYNLFLLPSVMNNPDLAAFLVHAGEKYAKPEYKLQFKNNHQASSTILTDFPKNTDAVSASFYLTNPYYVPHFIMAGINPKSNTPNHATHLYNLIAHYQDLVEANPTLDISNLIEFFINIGFDVNQRFLDLSPLYQAINQSLPIHIIQKLLKAGANPHTREDFDQKTTLINCALNYQNKDELIPILLEYGVNPLIKNTLGNKASDLVEDPKIKELLLQAEKQTRALSSKQPQ